MILQGGVSWRDTASANPITFNTVYSLEGADSIAIITQEELKDIAIIWLDDNGEEVDRIEQIPFNALSTYSAFFSSNTNISSFKIIDLNDDEENQDSILVMLGDQIISNINWTDEYEDSSSLTYIGFINDKSITNTVNSELQENNTILYSFDNEIIYNYKNSAVTVTIYGVDNLGNRITTGSLTKK